jgi:hypothetical protein
LNGRVVPERQRAAASISNAGSTTLSTRPIPRAALADSVRPVSIMSIAAGAPTRRGRRALPPQPGKMPSLGFGQADPGGRIVAGHAVAAGQRDFGAAAHAEAVDRGDRGAGQFGQSLEHVLAASDRIVHGALAVEFLEFLEVGAGDEAAGLGRAITTPFGRVDRDAFQHVGQFDQHVLRERVDRRVGTVELQHQHAVVAAMRAPVAESQPVEACGGGMEAMRVPSIPVCEGAS